MSGTRLDPTAMGLLFIGFVTLVVGMFGIEAYLADEVYVGLSVFAVALFGGLLLGAVALFAYKANSGFGTATFAWVSLTLLLLAALGGAFEGLFTFNFADAWFVWVVVTIFYFVFALWALLAGSPKLLVAILAVTGLAFLFLGLALHADEPKNMYLLLGVFGIIDFVLATYLGLALTEELGGKLKAF